MVKCNIISKIFISGFNKVKENKMQIHSVDNTNFQALKINPKLRAELVKSTGGYIKSFDNYGKEMAGVTLYNVVFDENIHTPKILHSGKNAIRDYFAELKKEETYLETL